jgi:mono/diheme cytochrome c family protein
VKTIRVIAVTCFAHLAVGSAIAAPKNVVIDNFSLLDQRGKFHELHYLSDTKAVVMMTHDNECASIPADIAALEKVKATYADRGVEFLMLNVNDDRSSVAKQIGSTGSTVPVLIDEARLVGESLQAKRAGEVFVIDPKGWRLTYRGALDRGKPVNGGVLANALDQVLKGAAPPRAVAAKGCKLKVSKPDEPSDRVAYAEHVAPLLIDNCVTCHRTGGIGPFAMTDYTIVRGFAPMIREVIRTKRMPPWHADPHYGTYQGDRSLTTAEAQTIVHWIEAGAPRGKGPDPLASLAVSWPEWSLGKPDLLIEVPAFDVPATGTIDYQRHTIKNPTGRDLWLRASDILPGDRSVLHHVLIGLDDARLTRNERRLQSAIGSIGLYVPGGGPYEYPAETGIFIPKDGSFTFQMHYTSSGKPVRDATRAGFYFSKEQPKYELKTALLIKPGLKIPANTKEYSDSMSQLFAKEVLAYAFFPHAHFRGRASSFTAKYPDGREETLLSVPKYDFNWQATYALREPRLIPAGTRITHTTTYDNSAQNRANPDPNRIVPWGEQSWDEMLYGTVIYREMTPREEGEQRTAGGGR